MLLSAAVVCALVATALDRVVHAAMHYFYHDTKILQSLRDVRREEYNSAVLLKRAMNGTTKLKDKEGVYEGEGDCEVDNGKVEQTHTGAPPPQDSYEYGPITSNAMGQLETMLLKHEDTYPQLHTMMNHHHQQHHNNNDEVAEVQDFDNLDLVNYYMDEDEEEEQQRFNSNGNNNHFMDSKSGNGTDYFQPSSGGYREVADFPQDTQEPVLPLDPFPAELETRVREYQTQAQKIMVPTNNHRQLGQFRGGGEEEVSQQDLHDPNNVFFHFGRMAAIDLHDLDTDDGDERRMGRVQPLQQQHGEFTEVRQFTEVRMQVETEDADEVEPVLVLAPQDESKDRCYNAAAVEEVNTKEERNKNRRNCSAVGFINDPKHQPLNMPNPQNEIGSIYTGATGNDHNNMSRSINGHEVNTHSSSNTLTNSEQQHRPEGQPRGAYPRSHSWAMELRLPVRTVQFPTACVMVSLFLGALYALYHLSMLVVGRGMCPHVGRLLFSAVAVDMLVLQPAAVGLTMFYRYLVVDEFNGQQPWSQLHPYMGEQRPAG